MAVLECNGGDGIEWGVGILRINFKGCDWRMQL
jgi:hypothetical protein